jgi:hypothetical protein
MAEMCTRTLLIAPRVLFGMRTAARQQGLDDMGQVVGAVVERDREVSVIAKAWPWTVARAPDSLGSEM